MYEVEILSSIDQENAYMAWEWMFKRTAWLQSQSFSPKELDNVIQETQQILNRLIALQDLLEVKIHATRNMQNAVQSYQQWERT